MKRSESHSIVSDSLGPHGLYSPGNSLGQDTGVGSLSLLQGIFSTQESKPGLLHCRWILYQLSHKGSPRILQLVANPFSSGSSRPRNQTRVSCIAGRFFTSWATKEALELDRHGVFQKAVLEMTPISWERQVLQKKIHSANVCWMNASIYLFLVHL